VNGSIITLQCFVDAAADPDKFTDSFPLSCCTFLPNESNFLDYFYGCETCLVTPAEDYGSKETMNKAATAIFIGMRDK
jgi:hypothetical protein